MQGSWAGQVSLPQMVFAAAVVCHPIASKLWVWCVYVAEKLVCFVITCGNVTGCCWAGNCQSKVSAQPCGSALLQGVSQGKATADAVNCGCLERKHVFPGLALLIA